MMAMTIAAANQHLHASQRSAKPAPTEPAHGGSPRGGSPRAEVRAHCGGEKGRGTRRDAQAAKLLARKKSMRKSKGAAGRQPGSDSSSRMTTSIPLFSALTVCPAARPRRRSRSLEAPPRFPMAPRRCGATWTLRRFLTRSRTCRAQRPCGGAHSLSTAPSTQSANVTLELPTGVYDLTEIAEQLNLVVNTWLHTNGYPVPTGSRQHYDFRSDAVATKTDVANFCSFCRISRQPSAVDTEL